MRTGRAAVVLIAGGVVLVLAGILLSAYLRMTETTVGKSESLVSVPDPDLTGMGRRVTDLIHVRRQDVIDQPDSAETWGALACALDVHGLKQESEVCYQQAHELNPSDFRWVYLPAINSEELGIDIDEILERYERAEAVDPTYAPMYWRLGNACARAGRMQEARNAYVQGLGVQPDFAACHRGLGQVLLAEGDVPAAVAHLRRANEMVPGDAAVAAAMAQAAQRLGDLDAAKEWSDIASLGSMQITVSDPIHVTSIQLVGVSAPICEKTAKSFMDAGMFAMAIPKLRIVEEHRPNDPTVKTQIGRAYLEVNDLENAREYLNKALELDELYAEAHRQLGILDQKLRLRARAIEVLQKQVDEDPDNVDSRLQFAEFLMMERSYNKAIEQFEALPSSTPLNHAAEFMWATALYQTDQLEGAAEHYRRSLEINPNVANTAHNLGMILYELGRTDEAVKYFRHALRVDPAHALAASALAKLGAGEPIDSPK